MDQPTVAVFGSSLTKKGSDEWSAALSAGSELARSGFSVITGGYGGTMEATSEGAALVGGHVIGVISPMLFPGRSGANPFVSETIEAVSLTDRIGIMIERSDAAIALPGSIGTAAELLVAWNVNYVASQIGERLLPTAVVGPAWAAICGSLASEARADLTDIHLVETADEAVDWVTSHLRIHGLREARF